MARVQVAFWVVAEYGEFARIPPVENVKSIVRASTRQRLSQEQEAAALTALFKIAAKAGPSAATLQTPLAGFLKAREASRDIMVARLASFTTLAIRYCPTLSPPHHTRSCMPSVIDYSICRERNCSISSAPLLCTTSPTWQVSKHAGARNGMLLIQLESACMQAGRKLLQGDRTCRAGLYHQSRLRHRPPGPCSIGSRATITRTRRVRPSR
jgi:hypothetical protein